MMTNHNANPICNSKGDPNPINPTNPNTRYRYEYGTLNSMFAQVALKCSCPRFYPLVRVAYWALTIVQHCVLERM